MRARRYRKRPVVIAAVKLTSSNARDVALWARDQGGKAVPSVTDGSVQIDTLEGCMTASPGDYVIRGTQGELYPCKPEVFAEVYQLVIDDP